MLQLQPLASWRWITGEKPYKFTISNYKPNFSGNYYTTYGKQLADQLKKQPSPAQSLDCKHKWGANGEYHVGCELCGVPHPKCPGCTYKSTWTVEDILKEEKSKEIAEQRPCNHHWISDLALGDGHAFCKYCGINSIGCGCKTCTAKKTTK